MSKGISNPCLPHPNPFSLPLFVRQSLRFYRAIALRREGNGYALEADPPPAPPIIEGGRQTPLRKTLPANRERRYQQIGRDAASK